MRLRLVLAAARLGREAEGHIERIAAAFHCDATYAALLRDAIQAAYAVCLAPSLPVEDRVERVRQLLDEALGAELPNPDEDVLDTVFGPRKAAPAENRPKVEAIATSDKSRRLQFRQVLLITSVILVVPH